VRPVHPQDLGIGLHSKCWRLYTGLAFQTYVVDYSLLEGRHSTPLIIWLKAPVCDGIPSAYNLPVSADDIRKGIDDLRSALDVIGKYSHVVDGMIRVVVNFSQVNGCEITVSAFTKILHGYSSSTPLLPRL
jgi:hypothetical protein